jgi:hypothetical protein
MNEPLFTNSQRAGTAGGTLLSLLFSISYGDAVKTAVTAAIGATVSFGVSFLLRVLVKRPGGTPPIDHQRKKHVYYKKEKALRLPVIAAGRAKEGGAAKCADQKRVRALEPCDGRQPSCGPADGSAPESGEAGYL